MIPRRQRYALLIATLCLSGCSCPAPKPIAHTGQIITLSDSMLRQGGSDTVRFGRMFSGETAVLGVRLRNHTSKPVIITTYDRTCGCTTLEFDYQPIMPDSDAFIRIAFDSRGLRGWQFKPLEVQLAGADAPLTIFVEAEVE